MSQLNNGIFKTIKRSYGNDILNSARNYEKSTLKLARYRNHLTFSIRCKKNEVQPNGLKLKCGLRSAAVRTIIAKAEKRILGEHIRKVNGTRNALQDETNGYERILERVLPNDVFAILKGHVAAKAGLQFDKVKERQKRKYESLQAKKAEQEKQVGQKTDIDVQEK